MALVQVNAARIWCQARAICFCPPPGVVDAESGLPGAVADPGRDVQHPVPERRDLAGGEVRFVGEAEELGPGNQVHRGHHDLEPRLVGGVVVAGEVPHPGGLGLPDPVLDPGVLPVPQIQSGQLTGHDPGRGGVSVMKAVIR